MFKLLFQLWGASFFLLNKVFLSKSERCFNSAEKKKWLILSWTVYLIGLPVWVIVFMLESNWIAACVEAGGAPAMVVGLYAAMHGQNKHPLWLDYLAKMAVILGLCISLYHFGGIFSIKQFLELGIAAGFLVGTYFLAKEKTQQGYLWFLMGNITCAILMAMEGYSILMAQQIISLGFVLDAYLVNRKNYNTQLSGDNVCNIQ